MLNKKYQIAFCDDNKIRFVDEFGNTVDPIALMEVAKGLGCSIQKESHIATYTTELKAFGAIEDGINTVVGQQEVNIKFWFVLTNTPWIEPEG